MLTRIMVLLVAGAPLTGCCASGTGCAMPTGGAPIAWDGLGQPPTADDAPSPEKPPQKRKTARNREIIVGPLNGAAPSGTSTGSDAKARYDEWTRQPNEDVEADARLARQTKICRGC
jgi:hypothetical protein